MSTTTNSPFPPTSTQIGGAMSGTINNISCAGPITATIFSAAGTALWSINSPTPINQAVSIPFSGGVPTITQKTGSSITLSY
jgi:hypothetical protein